MKTPDAEGAEAARILAQAFKLVTRERAAQHGDVVHVHRVAAQLWSDYLRGRTGLELELAGDDVATLLELLKIARRCSGRHNPDDYTDGAGYAAIAGALAARAATEN